jgi:hypothetical protein
MTPILLAALLLAQAEVTLTYREKLEGASRMPVAYSPDGKSFVYFKQYQEDGATKFVYMAAQSDGSRPRQLHATPVDSDDFLSSLTAPGMIAADGRVVVLTTHNGRGLRSDDPGKIRPALIDAEGKLARIDCELGWCGGAGFAGDRLVWLDTGDFRGGDAGYKLKMLTQGGSEVLAAGENDVGVVLRVSPDGTQAAFFVADRAKAGQVALRVVDLKSRRLASSPAFRTDDVTFDGLPVFFWDAAGKSLFCHVCTNQEARRPFELTRFDVAAARGSAVTRRENVGLVAVLDDDYAAAWLADGSGCTLVRFRDQKLFPLPTNGYILGGKGGHVVVADLDRNGVFAAELNLPR